MEAGDDEMVNTENPTSYSEDVKPIVEGDSNGTDVIATELQSNHQTEHSTTTSRKRQHDAPFYLNHKVNNLGTPHDKAIAEPKDDPDPIDNMGTLKIHDGPNEIQADSNQEVKDKWKSNIINGCAIGAGIAATTLMAAAEGGSKNIEEIDDPDATAERNAAILGQFEDKHRFEDEECIVDCLYYTTTCCECTIL